MMFMKQLILIKIINLVKLNYLINTILRDGKIDAENVWLCNIVWCGRLGSYEHVMWRDDSHITKIKTDAETTYISSPHVTIIQRSEMM